MQPNEEHLDRRLRDAHACGDKQALVGLYAEAAEMKEEAQGIDAECYYLTLAYVYALDTGAAEARDLHARLKARGREE